MLKSIFYTAFFAFFFSYTSSAQHLEMTAVLSGTSTLLVKLKAVDGDVTIGWTDLEFFFRNPTTSTIPNFAGATITINTTDFPGILVPYNGMNIQGTETGYNNYWFGLSYGLTATRTYNQDQEYLVCTISSPSTLVGTNLELCHNESVNFYPHYIALTADGGVDVSNLSGGNKFYGTGKTICYSPNNCPASTVGDNHILPISGTESVTLPAELLNFAVEKTGQKQVLLTWQTAAETQLREFQIERSSDGITWKNIGAEGAKGSRSKYVYLDENPPTGTIYYRLNIQNLDGSRSYSSVRSVVFNQQTGLSVYPNPTADVVHIAWTTDEPETKRDIQLFDSTGRLILVSTTENNTISIDLSGLTAGVYLLRTTTGTQTNSQEIIRL